MLASKLLVCAHEPHTVRIKHEALQPLWLSSGVRLKHGLPDISVAGPYADCLASVQEAVASLTGGALRPPETVLGLRRPGHHVPATKVVAWVRRSGESAPARPRPLGRPTNGNGSGRPRTGG